MKYIIVLLFGVFLISGCDSLTSTDKEKKPVFNSQNKNLSNGSLIRDNRTDNIISLDQKFVAVATAIPGFGGIFFDENGQLTVYQKNPGSTSKMKSALTLLPGLSTANKANAKILEANYDYSELGEWRMLLRREVLGQNSVITLDIDETRNKIFVGVEDSTRLDEVINSITDHNIPLNAFKVITVAPFITQQVIPPGPQGNSLGEKVDPKAGGLQIENTSFGNNCTLGFNVIWYNSQTGTNERGFVTNSHCTDRQGTVLNTGFGQHNSASSNFIGAEVEDPPYFTGTPTYYTCPAGEQCRLSDSALINYSSGIDAPIGRIYKTHFPGTGNDSGSKIHDGVMFTITAQGTYPYAGQILNKMGYVTGWTQGGLSSTCMDIQTQTEDGTFRIVTYLCQGVVNANTNNGDSGSPVFMEVSGENNVRLEGILWGKAITNGTVQFAFSPIASVTQELSIVDVF